MAASSAWSTASQRKLPQLTQLWPTALAALLSLAKSQSWSMSSILVSSDARPLHTAPDLRKPSARGLTADARCGPCRHPPGWPISGSRRARFDKSWAQRTCRSWMRPAALAFRSAWWPNPGRGGGLRLRKATTVDGSSNLRPKNLPQSSITSDSRTPLRRATSSFGADCEHAVLRVEHPKDAWLRRLCVRFGTVITSN